MNVNLQEIADSLIDRAVGGQATKVQRVAGGQNNQVCQVETDTEQTFALKTYVQHANDLRDRLGAEYAFYTYAANLGIDCLPKPLASDTDLNAALYSWIDGRPATLQDVDEAALTQVLAFLQALDAGRDSALAAALPQASEACLAVEDHIATVDRRLTVLRKGLGNTKVEESVVAFLNDVQSVWIEIQKRVTAATASLEVFSTPLPRQRQCISPSDLGFHNVLIRTGGDIAFLDFEYAGWDDPAKLVCDFFNQEKVPVPRKYYPDFRNAILGPQASAEDQLRADVLMPVYAVKWLIIRLNEFRPDGAHRRSFANPDEGEDERKAKQLEKARQAFEDLVADLDVRSAP